MEFIFIIADAAINNQRISTNIAPAFGLKYKEQRISVDPAWLKK